MRRTPRIVFVMGKGGTGRSSVATALGSVFSSRGENTLIVEWTFAEAIAPWFGQPPVGHEARAVAPRLSVMNFSLDQTLREYFVDHLGMRLLHETVIANRHVQRLIHAAPGLAELLFCGRLFWLSALAREETGVDYQRIVVDAPATGHGAQLFAIPRTLAEFDAAGLLSVERKRVTQMFADPDWTGAVVVTLAEELAMEESSELQLRLQRELRRPPLALIVNRCVGRFFSGVPQPPWLGELRDEGVLRVLYDELLLRRQRELALRADPRTVVLDDALLLEGDGSPLSVVQGMAASLEGLA